MLYRLEVLHFDNLGHLLELEIEIVRLSERLLAEWTIFTIVNDEIRHGQVTRAIAHGIGVSR
jgi:hypothetical protein